MAVTIERPCQAPIHAEGCDNRGISRDHFTPRKIARLWGWTNQQIGAPANLQYLSRACHAEKDRTTPRRIKLLKDQQRGKYVSLEEYQQEIKLRKRSKLKPAIIQADEELLAET